MIKLFRGIRQKLLVENRFNKYLLYAIGEIVLVVNGILIALQINNWNEENNQIKAEDNFYTNIKIDLNQDLEFIKLVQGYTKPKIEAYKLLNGVYANNYRKDKSKIDSLISIYLFAPQRTFYPVSGVFKSAIAGNEINTYKQKKIIQNIIKLYGSTYDRIIDNGKFVDTRWSGLTEEYIHMRRTKSFKSMDNKNYIKLLDDFHYHYVQLKWYNEILKDTESEVHQLLKSLK